jgi:hypothetical protein
MNSQMAAGGLRCFWPPPPLRPMIIGAGGQFCVSSGQSISEGMIHGGHRRYCFAVGGHGFGECQTSKGSKYRVMFRYQTRRSQ